MPYALKAERVNGCAGVVVVTKSGGDHTSVQRAIESISGAAADSTYLVWIAPGICSETVAMKPYVHLQGAGQEATVTISNSQLVGGSASAGDSCVLVSRGTATGTGTTCP